MENIVKILAELDGLSYAEKIAILASIQFVNADLPELQEKFGTVASDTIKNLRQNS